MAVGYVSKWVQVVPLRRANSQNSKKLFEEIIFSRFKVSRLVISDGGKYFIDKTFHAYLNNHGIRHKITTPYHPQTSGQIETSNKQIKNILQKTIGEMGSMWKDRLPKALWAYRIAYKTPLGMSPYQLVYGKIYHLPLELEHKAYWAIKHLNMDLEATEEKKKMQLSKLEEWREKAYRNSRIYKERTKRCNDRRIKKNEFAPRDRVLLCNSRIKLFGHGKWEGPFTVVST